MNWPLYILTLIFVLLFSKVTNGQADAGSLRGKVVNQKGEEVPFATIKAYDFNWKLKGYCKSYIDGSYKILPLDSGEYNILCYSAGYKGDTINNIKVELATNTCQDIVLSKKSGKRLSLYRPCPYCQTNYRYARILEMQDGSQKTLWTRKHCHRKSCWEKGKRYYLENFVSGKIMDNDGEVISGADIKIYKRSKLVFSTIGNAKGQFGTKDLKHGKYRFAIKAKGYKPIYNNVTTKANKRTVIVLNKN